MIKQETITPYLFEGYLIISLDHKWINIFGKIPTFVVQLDDDGRLHLVSKEKINFGKA